MSAPVKTVGRYALFDEIARGGMATVHLGRLLGPAGFSRTVAIKRLHPHLAKDPEFVTMLLDEARLAGRIQHPKVVATLDIVASEGELFIVMDYLHGETLARLLREASKEKDNAKRPLPPGVACAILIDTLHGLHAAHEVKGERGELLGLVHRDFTPQNIMVRRDGTALVVDFGVAKAAGRYQTTEEGKIKGKLPYMAPEQIRAETVTRRTDIYAAGAVLWETLTTKRLFSADNDGAMLQQILFNKVAPPSTYAPDVPPELDAVVMRALDRDPAARFATAEEMANAIEAAIEPVRPAKVAAWLESLASATLAKQAARLAELETIDSGVELTLPRALEEVNQAQATRLDVARPGPTLTESEIRRSKAEITTPKATPPSEGGAPPPPPPAEPTTRLESSSAVLVLAGPKPTRKLWPLLLVAGAAAAVVVAFLVLRKGPPRDIEAPTDGARSTSALGVASAPLSASNAAPSIAPSAHLDVGAASSASPAASSPVAVAPTSETSAPQALLPGATPPRDFKPQPPKPPAEDCSVPTYIDADGRKKYKRGCLK
ncbi:MAG: protein kinase [Polyangiaceae bacterium]